MSEPDRYIAGVPCWVDTRSPDPEASVSFYRDLFGWEFEGVAGYFIARIRGEDVAAVGAQPAGGSQPAVWNTYVWVEDADETATKVRAAGGVVQVEPYDAGEFGRMAIFADPSGAEFRVWQPNRQRGAAIVNEHGTLNFNNLNTRDVEGARAFYGAVFGWEAIDVGNGYRAWALAGYGEFLDRLNPGTLENMAAMGAPERFEDVVAALNPIPDDQPDVRPHWSVTFGVDDADAIAARASELGGRVMVAPFDAPWVRMTVIVDPQGAMFTASQFVPVSPDAAEGADAATGA